MSLCVNLWHFQSGCFCNFWAFALAWLLCELWCPRDCKFAISRGDKICPLLLSACHEVFICFVLFTVCLLCPFHCLFLTPSQCGKFENVDTEGPAENFLVHAALFLHRQTGDSLCAEFCQSYLEVCGETS